MLRIASQTPLSPGNGSMDQLMDDYAVYMLDPKGHITSWEPTIAKLKGYSANEVLGRHFSMFHFGVNLDATIQALQEAKTYGRYSFQGWRIRKDQTTFYAQVSIIPLIDPAGKHFGFANITKDISLHKNLLERLQRELLDQSNAAMMHERRLRLITDTLPNMVTETDANLNLRFVNSSSQKWFGKTEDQLIGRRLKDELPGTMYEEILPHLTKVIGGTPVSYDKEFHSDGINRYYLVDCIPEFDLNGKVLGLIAVATDVTQLREAKIAAEAANSAKSAFLANMAHEIRTPLGAVLGFSELLLKDDVSTQDRLFYQSAIARNGSLLSNIINDVLDFAKIEAGMLQIEHSEVNVIDVLADTLSTLEFHANAKNIKLKTSIDATTPRCIYTDPSRLKQILLNIVGNAIKFTANGTITVRVEPLTDQVGIRFVVEDTGIGISPEQAAKLFMPFKQSEDFSRRPFSGTGLGLAVSRQMAQLLGGNVQLSQTELGKGSTFTITINSIVTIAGKADGLEKKVEPHLQISESESDVPSNLNGARILLVEDSPDNQILVSHILQAAGASVVSALNGAEALVQSANSTFDLIVMDLQMPIMDGYQAAQEIRQRGDTTPIVALTAHAMREEGERCLAVGINAHLTKPINTHKLVSTLAKQFRDTSHYDQTIHREDRHSM